MPSNVRSKMAVVGTRWAGQFRVAQDLSRAVFVGAGLRDGESPRREVVQEELTDVPAAVAPQIDDESQALPPAPAASAAASASARSYLAATLDGQLSVKVAESVGLHVWHVQVPDALAA